MSTDQSPRLSEDEFNAAAQRLDELIREFEALPYPHVQEQIFEALQAIDTIHREAVGRLVALLCEPSQSALLQHAVEDPIIHTLLMLYDLVASDALPPEPPAEATRTFIPLDQLAPVKRGPHRPVFNEVARVEDVPPGTMKNFQVDGVSVLIANVAGEIYAVRDNCPGSVAPLHLGAFKPPVVVCAWHNDAFDIRTGKRSDGQPGPNLAVLPVTVSDGVIKLAVDTTPSAIPRVTT